MKWECLFWRRKAGTGHIASLVWNESPVIRQADRRWIGQRWEKKENEQYKGSIQADSENIGTKEVSLEERKIEEIHAEEPAPEILYEIELESDADDSFSVLRQEDIQFSGLGAVCSKAVRKDNGTTLLLTIELQDAGEIIGTVDAAVWAERGIGRWKKAPGASAYLVMLLPGCEACRTSASDEC